MKKIRPPKDKASQSVRRGEKRRRRAVRRAAGAGMLLLGLAAALAAGYTAGSFGYLWVEDRVLGSSLFTLREVRITGNQTLSEEVILQEAELRFGNRLMAMDLEKVRNRLLGNALIRDAAVLRRLPSGIVIEVEERVPAAVVRSVGDFIVDREGVVMSLSPERETASLPCLAGLTIKEGRVAADEMEALYVGMEIIGAVARAGFPSREEIDCIRLGPGSDAVILPASAGPLVYVGRENVLERLTRWRQVAGDLASRFTELEYIDLRADGMVVAKPLEAHGGEAGEAGEEI